MSEHRTESEPYSTTIWKLHYRSESFVHDIRVVEIFVSKVPKFLLKLPDVQAAERIHLGEGKDGR